MDAADERAGIGVRGGREIAGFQRRENEAVHRAAGPVRVCDRRRRHILQWPERPVIARILQAELSDGVFLFQGVPARIRRAHGDPLFEDGNFLS